MDVPILIVHVSGEEAAAQIRAARERGLPIHGETCPHYLFLTAEDLDLDGFEGAKHICSPPPRDARNQEAVWRGLENGVFDIVSSDHAPFRYHDDKGKMIRGKGAPFAQVPNGIPGIETRLPLVHSGGVGKHGMSLNRFVEVTATAPAKLFGLFPRKGTIAVGSDGDIVLFEPHETWAIRAAEQHSRIDYSRFEGYSVTGQVKKVFLRGQLIVDGTEWLGHEGAGEFLSRGESGKL